MFLEARAQSQEHEAQRAQREKALAEAQPAKRNVLRDVPDSLARVTGCCEGLRAETRTTGRGLVDPPIISLPHTTRCEEH